MVLEQTDGFEPNKQTPPATTKLGASDNLFNEVHATSGNFNNLVVGATDRSVAAKYNIQGTIPANVNGLNVAHNLNNAYPVVQVYVSGVTNGRHIEGSGSVGSVTGEYLVQASGVDNVYLYAPVALTDVNIVVVG